MTRTGFEPEVQERGFAAVERKFGREIAERIRNWPDVARSWALTYFRPCACHTLQPKDRPCATCDVVAKAVRDAELARDRVRDDPDYAIAQAEIIQKNWHEIRRGLPSRQRLEDDERESKELIAAWRRDNGRDKPVAPSEGAVGSVVGQMVKDHRVVLPSERMEEPYDPQGEVPAYATHACDGIGKEPYRHGGHAYCPSCGEDIDPGCPSGTRIKVPEESA